MKKDKKTNNYGIKGYTMVNFFNTYFNVDNDERMELFFQQFNFTHKELKQYILFLRRQLQEQFISDKENVNQKIKEDLFLLQKEIMILDQIPFQQNQETHIRLRLKAEKKRQLSKALLTNTTSIFCDDKDIAVLNKICRELRRIHTDHITSEDILKGNVVKVYDSRGEGLYYLVPGRTLCLEQTYMTMEDKETLETTKKHVLLFHMQ